MRAWAGKPGGSMVVDSDIEAGGAVMSLNETRVSVEGKRISSEAWPFNIPSRGHDTVDA